MTTQSEPTNPQKGERTDQQVKVSVLCKTYNHEPYIRDAIEGFIMQQTDFPFEIVIHDDASTDGTAEIVADYAARFPQLIVPILQQENQHSQSASSFRKHILPKLRGEYFASCEGDDYWTDPHKLQMLADYLDAHPECSAACHNTEIKYVKTRRSRLFNNKKHESDYNIGNVGTFKNRFYHTSGLMSRTELRFQAPPFTEAVPGVGDYPLRIWLLMNGHIHYFPQVMSVYRLGVPGSWSVMQKDGGAAAQKKVCQNEIKMLKLADEYSGYAYHSVFEETIKYEELRLMSIDGNFKDMLAPEYSHSLERFTPQGRARANVLGRFPFLKGPVEAARTIYHAIKGV